MGSIRDDHVDTHSSHILWLMGFQPWALQHLHLLPAVEWPTQGQQIALACLGENHTNLQKHQGGEYADVAGNRPPSCMPSAPGVQNAEYLRLTTLCCHSLSYDSYVGDLIYWRKRYSTHYFPQWGCHVFSLCGTDSSNIDLVLPVIHSARVKRAAVQRPWGKDTLFVAICVRNQTCLQFKDLKEPLQSRLSTFRKI